MNPSLKGTARAMADFDQYICDSGFAGQVVVKDDCETPIGECEYLNVQCQPALWVSNS
jgi:hypothetical protein